MTAGKRGRCFALIGLLLAPASAPAQPAEAAGDRGEDVYLAGPNVDVAEDVPGDLVAAGGAV